jgi:hypothetical protein
MRVGRFGPSSEAARVQRGCAGRIWNGCGARCGGAGEPRGLDGRSGSWRARVRCGLHPRHAATMSLRSPASVAFVGDVAGVSVTAAMCCRPHRRPTSTSTHGATAWQDQAWSPDTLFLTFRSAAPVGPLAGTRREPGTDGLLGGQRSGCRGPTRNAPRTSKRHLAITCESG